MLLTPIIRYLFVPAVALLLTFQIYTWIDSNFLSADKETKSSGEALIGGDFELTNQNGAKVKNTDFSDKYMLVYFGFTNCPMICPTDMAVLTQSLEILGDNSNKIQPIFITIDPERDTPEQINSFLSNFYPTFQGLTGTQEEIADVANKYRVYSKKVKAEDVGEYLMDHSAYTYLMDKSGKYITHFRHEQPAENIAKKLREYIK